MRSAILLMLLSSVFAQLPPDPKLVRELIRRQQAAEQARRIQINAAMATCVNLDSDDCCLKLKVKLMLDLGPSGRRYSSTYARPHISPEYAPFDCYLPFSSSPFLEKDLLLRCKDGYIPIIKTLRDEYTVDRKGNVVQDTKAYCAFDRRKPEASDRSLSADDTEDEWRPKITICRDVEHRETGGVMPRPIRFGYAPMHSIAGAAMVATLHPQITGQGDPWP